MGSMRRLALLASLVLGGVVSFATGATADLMPAGNYQIMTVTADAFSFNPTPFSEASVFVQDTTTQADPLVGPSSTTTVVQLSLFWNTSTASGGGCSLLSNPADFKAGSGATSAMLQTTLTGNEQPCDQFQQVLPALGVSATWTSTNNRGSGRTSSRYACGPYSSESLGTSANLGANADFSITAAGGSFSDSEASLSSGNVRIHAQGTLPSTCPQPGTKGAGPGPQAPGRFGFKSSLASFGPSQTDQTDPHVNVFVNRFTNTSTPQGGGAPSISTETDVELFVSGSAGFGFGCFVLQPPATFTFSLTSATLHMSIDTNTPLCPHSFGNFPFLPTDVSVTWTGSGPVATMGSDSQGSCANFSEETFFNDQSSNATATATLSFFQGTTFNGDASFLSTIDHSFQIQGVTRCPGV
jgi:hypothetical protein